MRTKPRLNLPLVLGLFIVGFSLTLAFAGPSLAPRNPLEETRVMQVDGKFVSAPFPPFTYPDYPLGTDGWGRDVLSQVLWALRPTLILTGYVAALRLLIGTVIGLLAGWNKNAFGSFLNGLIGAALSIPTLLVALAVVALTGDIWQPWGFVLGLSITGWADSARLVREQTRVAREQSFIEASRSLGQSNWAIVFNHILRLVLPYVWMLLALEISSTILLTAGLGFLGYYVGGEVWVWISDTTATRLRGMPELGQLLSGVNEDIYVSPWKLFASGTFVFITVLGFNLLGEGLRRVASSGSPSPRFFDLFLRLRWGLEEWLISPIKKSAKASPFAVTVLVIGLLAVFIGIFNQVKILTETQVKPAQSPGGHLWSSQYGSPSATLFVNAPGIESPKVMWAFSDAQGFSGGPAVAADGSVYVLTMNGSLHALNPDGSLKWTSSIRAGGVGAPGLDAEGNIYVTDMRGGLTSFTSTGEERWYLEIPDSFEATSGPVIGNNKVAYYMVTGNIRAASSTGTLLWDTAAFSRRVTFTPILSPDEMFIFLRNAVIDATSGEILEFESLPPTEQFLVGQSGLLYARIENKMTGWEYIDGKAEQRSYMEWSRTAFFGFPGMAGVFVDGGMWLHYSGEGTEDSSLLWLDKKGNMLNRAQFPYRPSVIGGMDENFVFYICGTRGDHAECSAVEKEARESKWSLPLEGSVGISGVALIPGQLYVASEEGMLYAIGDQTSTVMPSNTSMQTPTKTEIASIEPARTAAISPTSPSPNPSFTQSANQIESSTPAVTVVPEKTVIFDFFDNYCNLEIRIDGDQITCQDNDIIAREEIGLFETGTFFGKIISIRLSEDRLISRVVLRTSAIKFSAYDTLEGYAGCLGNAHGCSILFRIYFAGEDNEIIELWVIGEFFDGRITEIDFSLSSIAGRTGSLVLQMDTLNISNENRAAWINPRILGCPEPAPSSTEVPAPMVTVIPVSPLAVTSTITPVP